jgi:hypothetical protein
MKKKYYLVTYSVWGIRTSPRIFAEVFECDEVNNPKECFDQIGEKIMRKISETDGDFRDTGFRISAMSRIE